MNDQMHNGDDHPSASVIQDAEGHELMPPVLDMQAQHEQPGLTTLPSDLPDLSLPPVAAGRQHAYQPTAAAVPMKGKGGKTVMPKGWTLNGDIESQSDVQVGCQITGGIRMTTSNRLEVLHGAAVVGSIKATDVVVRGYVEGEIDASGGTVSIEEGATIRGKVIYTGIRMDGGEHQMELVHVPRPKVGAGQAS